MTSSKYDAIFMLFVGTIHTHCR